ncbi:hypothetical protein GQ43DRAFT_477303 [Delitschia confertaspora ATCC 74209]|uniref:Uncharacterized protein n=1 Tax=Delitschia confertaspora ATCC 74209 TaxID=1513339 RepID=A0A9P4JUP6_9PLEO|nr:hypothetical protein GQ43DRAFT_477303 [Delitschia confertaspora ATCC 74209]
MAPIPAFPPPTTFLSDLYAFICIAVAVNGVVNLLYHPVHFVRRQLGFETEEKAAERRNEAFWEDGFGLLGGR